GDALGVLGRGRVRLPLHQQRDRDQRTSDGEHPDRESGHVGRGRHVGRQVEDLPERLHAHAEHRREAGEHRGELPRALPGRLLARGAQHPGHGEKHRQPADEDLGAEEKGPGERFERDAALPPDLQRELEAAHEADRGVHREHVPATRGRPAHICLKRCAYGWLTCSTSLRPFSRSTTWPAASRPTPATACRLTMVERCTCQKMAGSSSSASSRIDLRMSASAPGVTTRVYFESDWKYCTSSMVMSWISSPREALIQRRYPSFAAGALARLCSTASSCAGRDGMRLFTRCTAVPRRATESGFIT